MPIERALRTLTDEELVALAQDGGMAAFEELVRRYQVPVLHFLMRKAQDRHEAEDLVQETFVRAFRKLHLCRTDGSFRPWLFTLAHRVLLNAQRKRRPVANDAAFEGRPAEVEDPSGAIETHDSGRFLWATAAEVLAEEQFTALWLFYVEDMSIRDVAAVLDMSETAVKTSLFRARRKLVPYLQRFDPTPPRRSEPKTASRSSRE
ncbi:MAG: sigma-70 family RNA polymerase sigma factor [Planctomycetota bacterium]|nr:MAG: sigma-70 family RNA polymerase sigma factor [Planctomycetota bacterium]